MGNNYSYYLYFENQDKWNVLKSIALLSENNQNKGTVIITESSEKISLPFSQFKGTEQIIFDRGVKELDFNISLNFEIDNAIRNYNSFKEESNQRTKIPIGFIWFGIHFGKKYVLFTFTASTNEMSWLFFKSNSIKETFISLLRKHNGKIGIFEEEERQTIIWKSGREISEEITCIELDVDIDDLFEEYFSSI